jgi:hypothetical protein
MGVSMGGLGMGRMVWDHARCTALYRRLVAGRQASPCDNTYHHLLEHTPHIKMLLHTWTWCDNRLPLNWHSVRSQTLICVRR